MKIIYLEEATFELFRNQVCVKAEIVKINYNQNCIIKLKNGRTDFEEIV